jgi:hypothetical protein
VNKLYIAFASLIIIAACNSKQKPPVEIFAEKADLGSLKLNTTYNVKVHIKNNTNHSILIEDHNSTCSCTMINLPKNTTISANADSIFNLNIVPNKVSEASNVFSSFFRIKDMKDFVKMDVVYKCVP